MVDDPLEDDKKLVKKRGWRVVYVPHEVIEDYNATYHVAYENMLITTNASKEIGVPLNEIWISEMWRPYEKFILFHEVREIRYKAEGFSPSEAHRKAGHDGFRKWRSDPAFHKMLRDVREMDRKTAERKKAANRVEKQPRNVSGALSTLGMSETQLETVIIRSAGEMGIKATWTRKLYERRLINNVKAVLKHCAISYDALTRRFGRLYLKTSKVQRASQELAKIFGVSSISPALQITSELSDIVKRSVFLGGQRLRRGSSFAVRCRRIGEHAYTSQEVCREVGRQILDAFPNLRVRVDLKHPDVTIGIEIREDQAFVFADVIKGVGGLPLGTQPRVVCLLEEDVNSSVACWLVMKRGCPIIPLYFDNTPFTDEKTTELTLETARILFNWAVGFPRNVYVISNGQNLAEIQKKCPEELAHVVSRRLMYRIAERMAETKNAEGIVSGESLGEPPDQPLENMRLFDEAVRPHPIHRPVLGLTDAEVEQLAKKIGIRETSHKKMRGGKRGLEKPAKTSTLREVEAAEKGLNIDGIVEESTESLRILSV